MGARRRLWVAAIAAGLVLGAPTGGSAQEVTRVAATVDYVGADGVYLTVGSEQGAARGDTLDVFADSLASQPVGRVVLTSVTRRRSVALALPGTRRLAVGDAVFLPLVLPSAVASGPVPPAAAPASTTAAAPLRTTASATGADLSGRLSLDFDARETHTTWGGDLFGESRRRFATPTTRLSLQAGRLPGGFVLSANLRASYRYDDLRVGPPPLSIRASKEAIDQIVGDPARVDRARFEAMYRACFDSSDYAEGRTAFMAKRPPVFTGS